MLCWSGQCWDDKVFADFEQRKEQAAAGSGDVILVGFSDLLDLVVQPQLTEAFREDRQTPLRGSFAAVL